MLPKYSLSLTKSYWWLVLYCNYYNSHDSIKLVAHDNVLPPLTIKHLSSPDSTRAAVLSPTTSSRRAKLITFWSPVSFTSTKTIEQGRVLLDVWILAFLYGVIEVFTCKVHSWQRKCWPLHVNIDQASWSATCEQFHMITAIHVPTHNNLLNVNWHFVQ